MDTAIVTTRMVELDAMSNFTMASAAALRKLGKVTVYAFAYERPALDGVGVRLLGGENRHSIGTNARALTDTFRLARELSRYDALIIVNPDVGSMPAYHLAKRYNPGLKVMWTFHGLTPVRYVSGSRDRWLMRIRKLAYVCSMKRLGRIQVFSDYIKKEVAQWGIDPARIVVMPLGIGLASTPGDGESVRERYGAGNRFLLLYVGRLVNFKHVDELIRAVATLDDAGLIIVGGGPERASLGALAKGLGAEGRIWLAGRVPDEDLPGYYAACDAWATASRHEGFCVPVIEAMAAGKPVVVPDVAAMPETAGPAGLVYRSGDVKGLADKLSRLMQDKALYASLSSEAADRARGFDMVKVLEKYVDMCSGL